MRIELQSKPPHKTCWLVLHGEKVSDIISSLVALGWQLTKMIHSSSNTHILGKHGTGLFNGWTDEEFKKNVLDVHDLCQKFNLDLTHAKLESKDLL